MTKKEYRQKCKQLKKEANKLIDDRIEKLLNSGAIDLKKWDNDFILPKAVMAVIGSEIAFQFKPFTPEGKKAVNNFKYFI